MDGIVAQPFGPHLDLTNEDWKEFIGRFVGNGTLRDRLYSHYYSPSNFPEYHYSETDSYSPVELAYWTLNSDTCVLCPTLKMAEQIWANEAEPEMFVYFFKVWCLFLRHEILSAFSKVV